MAAVVGNLTGHRRLASKDEILFVLPSERTLGPDASFIPNEFMRNAVRAYMAGAYTRGGNATPRLELSSHGDEIQEEEIL